MNTERTPDWWLSLARREGNDAVGAGLLAVDPHGIEHRQGQTRHEAVTAPSEGSHPAPAVRETRIAFSKFVELARRERGLTVEGLAEKASLDVADIVRIEEIPDHTPDPRTVYQLSTVFGVQQQRLMQVAGLVVANDDSLRLEAVRFAARSESIEKLTHEQQAALNEFVAVLSKD